MPTWKKRQTVAYCPAELEELLRRRFTLRLLLNDGRLICLFTLKIGKHQLPQLHQLLNFLLRDLPENLQRFHFSARTLCHGAKRIQNRLLALQLLPLQAGGTQGSKRSVQ